MKALCQKIAAIAPEEWACAFNGTMLRLVLPGDEDAIVTMPENPQATFTVRLLEWLNKTDRNHFVTNSDDHTYEVGRWCPGVIKEAKVKTLAECALYGLLWFLEAGERE